MSPRIAPMHVHCELTTVECREPLLELCSGDNGSRLLNIEGKCSHVRAKTGRISGHLPDCSWVRHNFLHTVSTKQNKNTTWLSLMLTSPALCKKLWRTLCQRVSHSFLQMRWPVNVFRAKATTYQRTPMSSSIGSLLHQKDRSTFLRTKADRSVAAMPHVVSLSSHRE